MRSTWTDSRLDDFKDGVDSRLDDLNGRVSELSGRIDGLQNAMVHGIIAITATMITGFLGLAGLIATQL